MLFPTTASPRPNPEKPEFSVACCTTQHPAPLPGILRREAPIHPAHCTWWFLLPPGQPPFPGTSHDTLWPRCCGCFTIAWQLFISSPHLDPIAACGEKSHRALEIGGRAPSWLGLGELLPGQDRRVTQQDCHHGPHLQPRSTSPYSPHLPLWSLSPTGEKWAPAFQQCWEMVTTIQSSPSSFFLSLPVFLAIYFGLFFPKIEVVRKLGRKQAGGAWGNKDLEIVLGPHSSSPPSPKSIWNFVGLKTLPSLFTVGPTDSICCLW